MKKTHQSYDFSCFSNFENEIISTSMLVTSFSVNIKQQKIIRLTEVEYHILKLRSHLKSIENVYPIYVTLRCLLNQRVMDQFPFGLNWIELN